MLNRRDFLKKGGIGGAGVAAGLSFPSIIKAVNAKPTIRVVGTHVTLKEPIRRKAEEELGINIEFYPGGSAEVLLKASTDPHAFDLYEQWSNSINVLWQANTIQPIDINRLTYWDEVNGLTKHGRITENATIGKGDAPHKLL